MVNAMPLDEASLVKNAQLQEDWNQRRVDSPTATLTESIGTGSLLEALVRRRVEFSFQFKGPASCS